MVKHQFDSKSLATVKESLQPTKICVTVINKYLVGLEFGELGKLIVILLVHQTSFAKKCNFRNFY